MADEHLADQDVHFADLLSPTRRTLLRGVAVVGVAGLTGASLVACGGDEDTTAGGGATPASPATQATSPAATSEPASGGEGLAKTADIPVGGGKIFQTEKIVVTQPTSGEFKAFTAVCTHMGCTVATVSGGTINCACHGSKYSVADGSVKNGPAPRPLAAKTVTVKGEDITVS
jgi:Rieske Fe-S protein